MITAMQEPDFKWNAPLQGYFSATSMTPPALITVLHQNQWQLQEPVLDTSQHTTAHLKNA